jgi:hypothetical protein
MKKTIALIFAVSTLFLAGCTTASHASKWEYKSVRQSVLVQTLEVAQRPDFADLRRQRDETLLNDLGKDGWIYIKNNDGLFYFKRPVK